MRRRNRAGQFFWLWALPVSILFSIAAFTRPPPFSVAPEKVSQAIEYSAIRVFGGESWVIGEASLSPDGRWIAFAEGDQVTRLNLWLTSTRGGGPVRLTKGSYLDDSPVWFPSSDRIAFRSNRTPIWAIMTIPIDAITGEPAGPPRQVTLDPILADFDVSPDGHWIAYSASNTQGGSLLRILPATGGIAQTLAEGVLSPVWSPDGTSVYYPVEGGRSAKQALMRVSVDGGRPQPVFTWPGRILVLPRGTNRNFIMRQPANGSGIEIANLDGKAVGRIVMPEGMSPLGISREGDQILGIDRERSAPLMILPVNGGPARRLGGAHSHDEPLGWSPDGRRVLFRTRLNGKLVLFYAPAAGGSMPQVRLPEEASGNFTPVLSRDGNHILYAVERGDDEVATLKVYSIATDSTRELSRSLTFIRSAGDEMEPTGAGGTLHRDSEDYLYYEKRNGRFELRASPPAGPSRLLRSFEVGPPRAVAVHGSRIAWVENSANDCWLLLATAGEPRARRLLNRKGMFDMPVWSPDGWKIAFYYFDPSRSSGKNWDPAGRNLVVLEVNPSGEIVRDQGSYSIPAGHWWNPRWLPDGRSILVSGMDGNVWQVPLEPGVRPIPITQDDPNDVWDFRLSPDGRNIAYPSMKRGGSTIWLLNLEKSLNQFRGPAPLPPTTAGAWEATRKEIQGAVLRGDRHFKPEVRSVR